MDIGGQMPSPKLLKLSDSPGWLSPPGERPKQSPRTVFSSALTGLAWITAVPGVECSDWPYLDHMTPPAQRTEVLEAGRVMDNGSANINKHARHRYMGGNVCISGL